jgi:hypothetical protein
MKTYIASSIILLFTLTGLAQTPPKPIVKIDQVAQSNRLVKTGGTIMMPSSGPHMLIINAQKRVPAAIVQQASTDISRILRVPIQFKEDDKVQNPMETASDVLKDKSIAVLLIVSDTPKYPAMLVAPEARWVVVNTATLAEENPSGDLLASRLNKELWRAFGMVLGGGISSFPDCLMQPIFKVEQLDELKGRAISPDPLTRMLRTITKLGIQPQRLTTYRKACEEGWAPMPTNSFQKAIWEETKK